MKSDTHEEWKPIERAKSIYSVSNKGRIRNNRTGYILKPIKWTNGYMKVNLKVNGNSDSQMIHRLVATAFIPNPENKPEVNHKNGIHTDNRLENLEWVTGEENRKHAYETELVKHKDDRFSGYLHSVWKRKHRKAMCDEWQDYLKFYEWCYDNDYTDGLKICRYDTTDIYNPSNCYISKTSQHPKMDISKRKHSYCCFGKLLTIEELSQKYNMSSQTIVYRLKKGMNIEDAVTKPLEKNGRPRKEAI